MSFSSFVEIQLILRKVRTRERNCLKIYFHVIVNVLKSIVHNDAWVTYYWQPSNITLTFKTTFQRLLTKIINHYLPLVFFFLLVTFFSSFSCIYMQIPFSSKNDQRFSFISSLNIYKAVRSIFSLSLPECYFYVLLRKWAIIELSTVNQ